MPERVGPYRVLDVLGAGAMGVVYLAEPAEPPLRRVALKVVRAGLDAREVLERFEAERSAMELLEHPAFARVLEVGATEDGRAWFAMERVRGVPVTEYCDRERLAVPRRVELLGEVCEALQHAHARGLVHRNVKPSNILVVGDAERPELRVTDLGVATALDQRLTEDALYTAQGLLSATPAYVSPELLDPAARDVDRRADVYSVGVLLYELLVGGPPFEPRRLRQADWARIVDMIRQEVPPPPSRHLRGGGDAQAREVAAQRGTNPRELARQLRGDLEAITLKALEKDPALRYPTPGELAVDLHHHLLGEPVSARPSGPWSRLLRALGRTPARVSPNRGGARSRGS